MLRSVCGLIFLSISSFLTADAQKGNTPHLDPGMKSLVKSADLNFAMRAAEDSAAEAKLGQLAAVKGQNSEVRAFGQRMVEDHSKMASDLEAIAAKRSMTLPTGLDGKDQGEYDKLEKLSGTEFDRFYIKSMIKDHTDGLKDFTREAKTGKDEQMKAFATRSLPVLQDHLDRIRSIQTEIPGPRLK